MTKQTVQLAFLPVFVFGSVLAAVIAFDVVNHKPATTPTISSISTKEELPVAFVRVRITETEMSIQTNRPNGSQVLTTIKRKEGEPKLVPSYSESGVVDNLAISAAINTELFVEERVIVSVCVYENNKPSPSQSRRVAGTLIGLVKAQEVAIEY